MPGTKANKWENSMSVRINYNFRPLDKKKFQIRYYDNSGRRRSKQFLTTEERDRFRITLGGELLEGTHIPDGASKKIREAGKLWLESEDVLRLRQSTQKQYETHLRLHIYPFIGNELLSKFDVGEARRFRDNLFRNGRSDVMIQKAMTTLHSLLADAVERKFCKSNAVRDLKKNKKRKEKRKLLQVGIDIPTTAEIHKIIEAAQDEWRAIILTMIFTGVRSNELLAIRWCDVDLEKQVMHIRQALDRGTGTFHEPKSEAGKRTIPILSFLANTLKEHKLRCPPRQDRSANADLVFHKKGKPIHAQYFVKFGLLPTLSRAGIISGPLKKNGRVVYENRKYTGPHCYRHWYCTWCINSKEDGGLGLDVKRVSERMGHSSVMITLNVYGHLFPQTDQREAMAEAERRFMALR